MFLNRFGFYSEAQVFDIVEQETRALRMGVESRDNTILELQKIIAGYEEANKPKKHGRPRKVAA